MPRSQSLTATVLLGVSALAAICHALAAAQNGGCEVYWVSEGRRQTTHERAVRFGLRDAGTLAALCSECSIIISVCPPHSAESLANDVLTAGFAGVYVDANAIAPQRTIKIGETMSSAGITFVDGGIIGFPAWKPGTTCLYLSGPRAGEVAECFSGGPLETKVMGTAVGRASATGRGDRVRPRFVRFAAVHSFWRAAATAPR